MQNISIEAAKAKGFISGYRGYKQYGNRHLSKEKIDEYCNSVKEAKEKSLEK